MNRKRLGILAVATIAVAVLVGLPLWLVAQEADPPDAGEDRRGWHQDCDDCSHGYLGVSLRDLTPELQEHFGVAGGGGVLVAAVTEEGPAEAAGVLVGDVLLEIDGDRIDSARELRREVRRRGGDTATVELIRDRQPLSLQVTLGERRAHGDRHIDFAFDPERWAEMAEHWAEVGERWGRWGEEMGERWGRWGEEMGERWGQRGDHWGEHWGELGAEIGLEVAGAMAETDWDQIGAAIERSMQALERIDWEALDEELERSLEEMEERLAEMERRLEDGD